VLCAKAFDTYFVKLPRLVEVFMLTCARVAALFLLHF